MKKLLTIILALCIAVPTMADTLTVVSDETVQIIEVINKDGLVSTPVDTSGDSLYAVSAYEPNLQPHEPDGYPFVYLDPYDDVNESLWDNRVSPTFDGTGADWIWETPHSEGPADYLGTDPLYDPDASGNGRVVVFRQTFTIESTWDLLSAAFAIAVDNCYEFSINGSAPVYSATVTYPGQDGWENVGMMKQDVVNYTGWSAEGIYNVASLLVEGENTIEIIAGNEFHGYVSPGVKDTANNPIPALNGTYGDAEYYQYNPGGLIFALVVEYEEILTYDICGAKFEWVDDDIGSALPGWTINLYNDVPELIATTTTDGSGEYCFTDLLAGVYAVEEVLQAGWTQVYPDGNPDWVHFVVLPDDEGLYFDFYNEQIEEPNGYCSFTQGFWGNAGGQKFGETTTEILVRLLAATSPTTPGKDPVVVGDDGTGGGSITFDTAACILNRLPAGGPAKALPFSNDRNCAGSFPNSFTQKDGRFKNVLVGQVVALTLNIRYDGNLGDMVLPGDGEEDGVFCVVFDDGCPEQYTIPWEVIDMLGTGATVFDLLDLANEVLAYGKASNKQISAINDAVTAINEAFDECADLIDCPTGEICDNGCDDDFDGDIDLFDEDCLF